MGASAITDLCSDVGHRLGAAQLISTTGFPGPSAGPGAAQGMTGSIKACHGVGAAVRWAQADFSALPAGSSYDSFSMRNADLFEQLLRAFLGASQDRRISQSGEDVQRGQRMDYPTVSSTTTAPDWTAFCEHLDIGNLAGATALVRNNTAVTDTCPHL